jgi:hypothetical protein
MREKSRRRLLISAEKAAIIGASNTKGKMNDHTENVSMPEHAVALDCHPNRTMLKMTKIRSKTNSTIDMTR